MAQNAHRIYRAGVTVNVVWYFYDLDISINIYLKQDQKCSRAKLDIQLKLIKDTLDDSQLK